MVAVFGVAGCRTLDWQRGAAAACGIMPPHKVIAKTLSRVMQAPQCLMFGRWGR